MLFNESDDKLCRMDKFVWIIKPFDGTAIDILYSTLFIKF